MTGRRGETGAALFDFDGTLIDSFSPRKTAHRAVGEFLCEYMRSHGCELKWKVLSGPISRLEREMNERRVYDRNLWWEEILRGYLGEGIRIPPSILTEASSLYWERIKRESRVYPGVGHMLQSLKQRGVTVGLISDTDGLEGMKIGRVEESRLRGFFDAIVVAGEDTEEVKPSTQPFTRICELIDVTPEQCVFVGDNPEVDVMGPRELGMKVIIIEDENPQNAEGALIPDFFMRRENIRELGDLIPQLLEKREG
jgi:HAD superfamily hydrolase (TIGR01549 family)